MADHFRLVDGVGDFRHDDALAPVLLLLDRGFSAHGELSASMLVHRRDAVEPANLRAGGEVGAFHELHEFVDRARLPVLDVVVDAVAQLPEVVGRDVRRHAHGDARRAVEQKIRQLGGQDGRLARGLVVVRDHIHRVLLDILEHFLRGLAHAHLGVTHGRRAVAVDGAEVAVAVHERHAEREILRHAHDRVVDGGVAVRVVLAHDFADDAGGLHVLGAARHVQPVHAVKRTAVHGLQSVPHVGQCAPHDDTHRIVDVVARH